MDKIGRKNTQKKVMVAMSGGIDSSVAAALLKRAGFDVIGSFMKFWNEPRTYSAADEDVDLGRYENRCCSTEAENRARMVAKILKIPFYVFNFEKEFKKRVVDRFLNAYKKGITPNPCVVCNKEIKFGLFLEKALSLGIDYVASGHYARVKTSPNLTFSTGVENVKLYRLLKAKDKEKDQSYFLWQLNQKQLKRILFPLGEFTKAEVKEMAKKFKLPVQKTLESMEICFIQTTINDFLRKYLKEKPGKIITSDGKMVGSHHGLFFYTIGQRKGIGLAGGPYYILAKDLKKNLLIVTKKERDLFKKEATVKNVNWISGKVPKLPLKIKAKIRYRHHSAFAVLSKNLQSATYNLKFEKPQRAVTPGQSAVFYKGNEVLGGGIIV